MSPARIAVLVDVEAALTAALAARLPEDGLAVLTDGAEPPPRADLVVLGRGPDRTGALDEGAADVADAVEADLVRAHAAARRLLEPVSAARGTVVVLAALGEHPLAARGADSVADAGLLMLGRLLGAELAEHGARALVLCPAAGVAADAVADAVAWAAAAPAPAVNGAVIQVDATRTATLPMPAEEDAHA